MRNRRSMARRNTRCRCGTDWQSAAFLFVGNRPRVADSFATARKVAAHCRLRFIVLIALRSNVFPSRPIAMSVLGYTTVIALLLFGLIRMPGCREYYRVVIPRAICSSNSAPSSRSGLLSCRRFSGRSRLRQSRCRGPELVSATAILQHPSPSPRRPPISRAMASCRSNRSTARCASPKPT